MAKVDVPEYYGHAADNIDAVTKLIHDAADEGGATFARIGQLISV